MNTRLLPPGVLLCASILVCGCDGKDLGGPDLFTQRPVVELVVAPSKGDSTGYQVVFEWSGKDTDGSVVGYEYAVDPPAMPAPGNDTAWIATDERVVQLTVSATRPVEPLPPPGSSPSARDYHTVVVRAVDDDDLRSAPVSRSFTAYTVAPFTTIDFPDGNPDLAISTPDSLRVRWTGTDPDGAGGPVKYKLRLATASQIAPGGGPATAAEVQAFFAADAPGFASAGWDSVPGDSTELSLRDLDLGVQHYLAVVAVDEAGAYEPRFQLDSNVLHFVPTNLLLGPRMTVWNEAFQRTQSVGGVSLDPGRIFHLEWPAGTPVTFHWTAMPPQPGTYIAGYRWALDILDIHDETPRSGPDDLAHWSAWSSTETSVTLGPFPATKPHEPGHIFYLEARDALGYLSLFRIGFRLVEASFDRPLLVIDDLYGVPTQLRNAPSFPGQINLAGAYPLEAEADSFYVAQGGFPDSLSIRSSGTFELSLPGVFSDFMVDTLDYRFHPEVGVSLEILSSYQAVCWYTDGPSAARNGSKFGSVSPMTGLREINSVSRVNTLALYLKQGGKAWLFGEGVTSAIASGYWSRIGTVPRVPYTSGDDPRESVLYPGNFLYDFVHIRSELSLSGHAGFPATQLVACKPFLPAYYPEEPGAARTALRWPDLPRLTIANYRGAPASPSVLSTFLVHQPNHVPDLDTLYTVEAREPDPGHVYAPLDSDGFPNAIHYRGQDNGPGSQLVWFGFPLHYFEREQVSGVVRAVMRNFGISPGATSSRRAVARR